MESYIPLLSGFFGALIGAFASIVTIIVQSRYQNKREKIRMAAQMAIEEIKMSIDLASKSGKRAFIASPTAYLHYHMKLMELLENDSLDPITLRHFTEENREIMDCLKSLQNEREEQLKAEERQ
jgi:hypothetical protein